MNEKLTLSTQCYLALEKAILEGGILPGERLQCEELRERFQYGLSPIREALSKLAANHLASFEENKGFAVAKLTRSELIDAVKTFAEIECLCLRHAIGCGDNAWEGKIVAALYHLKKLETKKKVDYFLWAPVNRGFHDALVCACPLKGLLKLRNQLYVKHEWYLRLAYKCADTPLIRTNHQEHRKIAEYSLQKDTEMALDTLYKHITGGLEELTVKLILNDLIKEDS